MNKNIYSCSFRWISFFILLLIGAVGWVGESYLGGGAAVCGLLFFFLQLWLIGLEKKGKEEQTKKLKLVGFFALIPALGMLTIGIRMYAISYAGLPTTATYGVIALSGVLALLYSIQLVILRKKRSQVLRFYRITTAAAYCVPASLLVAFSLSMAQVESWAELSSISVITFAAVAVFGAINLIFVSFSGYKSTLESIRELRRLLKSKKLVFTKVSIAKDASVVMGRGIISLVSLSFFMFVNTLYSAGMGIAKLVVLQMRSQDREAQVKSYRLVGIIITMASLCYVIYSVRLFFGGKSGVYSMNIALVIALYTFVEFGINIRDALRLRKSHKLEAKALRAISFASTLLCFVLTQTAIMSFASEGDSSTPNAFSGIFFGGLAAATGLYVIFDSVHQKKVVEQ